MGKYVQDRELDSVLEDYFEEGVVDKLKDLGNFYKWMFTAKPLPKICKLHENKPLYNLIDKQSGYTLQNLKDIKDGCKQDIKYLNEIAGLIKKAQSNTQIVIKEPKTQKDILKVYKDVTPEDCKLTAKWYNDVLIKRVDERIKNKEYKSINNESFSPENNDNLIMVEEGVYYDCINERAQFNFLPKIQRRQELKKLWADCEKAEDLLNSKGEDIDSKDLYKIGDLALKIVTIMCELSSAIVLPFIVLVAPIPGYLILRLESWAFRIGEDLVAETYAKKVISKYTILKSRTKDKKEIEAIDKQIQRIKDSIKDVQDK